MTTETCKARTTAFLTVLPSGKVDVTVHETDRRGRLNPIGQRFMIAPWSDVLRIISPTPSTRVIVRAERA